LWQRNCSRDFKLKVEISTEVNTLSADPSSGFIASGNSSAEILQPDPVQKTGNAKGKAKQQRAVRQKYGFVTASKRGQRYRDYFNPDSTVQLRVMGMEDTVVRLSLPQLMGTHLFFVCLVVGHCNGGGTTFGI
jgi:hypothetical protein